MRTRSLIRIHFKLQNILLAKYTTRVHHTVPDMWYALLRRRPLGLQNNITIIITHIARRRSIFLIFILYVKVLTIKVISLLLIKNNLIVFLEINDSSLFYNFNLRLFLLVFIFVQTKRYFRYCSVVVIQFFSTLLLTIYSYLHVFT